MAALAFASLVFLSWSTTGRALLMEQTLSPMAESCLDSDGLASVLAEEIVQVAMNNSHASVLLDRQKRNFIAAMLATLAHQLETSKDDPKDTFVEQGGTATTDEAGEQDDGQGDVAATDDTGGQEGTATTDEAGEQEGTATTAPTGEQENTANNDAPESASFLPSKEFKNTISCFFGPGVGTANFVLDSINVVRSLATSCKDKKACAARKIIGYVGKLLKWSSGIYNIESAPCGKETCASATNDLLGLGTPASKNYLSLYVRVLGTGLVTTAGVWGTLLQCNSEGKGGQKLAPGTEWAYVVTKVAKAVKSIIFQMLLFFDDKPNDNKTCKQTATLLADIPGAASSIWKLDGQLKADTANRQAGKSSWCAGAIAGTAAQIPAFVAAYCGFAACRAQAP